MYKRHHPPSSQKLAQYFSRKESQQLCTLPITPHLFEEQLNTAPNPKNREGHKGEAPCSPSQLLAQPGFSGQALRDGFPHLLHGHSQRLPKLLMHVFSAGPFLLPLLPGLLAAIARTWSPISSKSFLAPCCLRSHAPLFLSDQYPKAFPAMIPAVYSCTTD